jgi:hypothetical protein
MGSSVRESEMAFKITGRSTPNTIMKDPEASPFIKDVLKLALQQEDLGSVLHDLGALQLFIMRYSRKEREKRHKLEATSR